MPAKSKTGHWLGAVSALLILALTISALPASASGAHEDESNEPQQAAEEAELPDSQPITSRASCHEFRRMWAPLHYKIFATRPEMHAEPAEVHSMMKALMEVYVHYAKLMCEEDTAAPNRIKKLRQLLEAGEIDVDVCNWANLARLNELIDYNSCYKINVIPYLDHHRKRLLMSCSGTFERQLVEALESKLIDEHVYDVGPEFFQMVRSRLGGNYHRSRLISNLLRLIHLRSNRGLLSRPPINERNTKSASYGDNRSLSAVEVQAGYDQLVAHSCHLFKHSLRSLLRDEFHLLQGGLGLFGSENGTISKWLGYSQFCQQLIDEAENLKRELVLANIIGNQNSSA